jgi:hypothetical protein
MIVATALVMEQRLLRQRNLVYTGTPFCISR